MSDEQPTPDVDEAPGWQVLDPDGNVVDSGPMVYAQAAVNVGEPSDENDEEQQ